MQCSNNDYRILKFIYDHPYITTTDLIKKFHPENEESFIRQLHSLWEEGYISNRVLGNNRDDDGTEQFDIERVSHLVTRSPADIIIEERRRNLYSFIIPYIITTVIAVASLLTNIMSILQR